LRLSYWREALTALPLLQAASDAFEPRFMFNKPYKIQIKQNSESDGANAIRIYTDGSQTKEGSRCGVYSRSLNLRIKWGMVKNTSVVQTELAGFSIATK